MSKTERLYDLSTLWRYASEIFPGFDRNSIDWDRAYLDFLPRVLEAGSEQEFHLLLAEFLNLLGDGHTDYRFPAFLLEETGYLPFRLVFLADGWFIREIEASKKPFAGTRILRVNGLDFDELLSTAFRYIYHVGNYSYPARLCTILPFLLKPSDNEIETSAGVLRVDPCPEFPAEMVTAGLAGPGQQNGRPKIRTLSGNILLVRMDDFQYAQAADVISGALRASSPAGAILDLRENIGGMTAYAARIAELFISGEFHGCRKRTRTMQGIDLSSASQYAGMDEASIERLVREGLCDHEEVNRCLQTAGKTYYHEYCDTFGAPGHTALYDGPVILLTSRNTISAAEDFTAMFRSSGRALLLGTPTHGSTGTPFLCRLRCGGHARICSVGYRLLDGTEFIGRGIQPDILLEMTGTEYFQGRDTVLEEAVRRLK